MAKLQFAGDALAVAQVDLITLVANAALETTDNLTGTINSKSVTAAAGSTDVDTACDTFNAAWNASTVLEHAEVTAGDGGTGISSFTADTPGKSFVLTATTTETGGGASDGQTFTRTASVANDGPNVWSANNFKVSGTRGTLPGASASDEVYIEGRAIDLLYGLDQSGIANTLALLAIAKSYTGKIGLPRANSAGYDEYRDTYLKIKAAHARIGYGLGDGSGRIKIDFGATACKCKVYGSGVRVDEYPSTLILGTAAGNIYEQLGGDVGIAIDEGEVSTWDEIYVSGGQLRIGAGVTMGKVNVSGNAQVWINWRAANFDTLYISDQAEVYLYGGVSNDASTGRVLTDVYLRNGAKLYLNLEQGSTVTNLFVGAKSRLDTSQGFGMTHASVVNPITVTNLAEADPGEPNNPTVIYDPARRIYWQAGLQLNGPANHKGFSIDIGAPCKMFVGGGSLS